MRRNVFIIAVFVTGIVILLYLHHISQRRDEKPFEERNDLTQMLVELKSQVTRLGKFVARIDRSRDTLHEHRSGKQAVTEVNTLQSGLSTKTRSERSHKCKIVDMNIVDKKDFDCVPMRTGRGSTPICVYDPRIDIFISHSLVHNHKRWEEEAVVLLEKLFDRYPDLQLLDLGANIGIYALTALKYGRQVLAVDPNFENLKRIRASVHEGKFPVDSIVLVQNAISDKYERIQLIPNKINVGGRGIMPAKSDENAADAIHMDDLLEAVKFSKAIMKIDIETSEARAMSHAEKMFDKIDIPIVFMEWNYAKVEPGGSNMRRFFESRGYSAYDSPVNGTILTGDHQKWTNMDVFWMRTNGTRFPSIKA
ncbi:uncharacterized protein LOC141898247 [Tubulanus polymorphus]|uniref:uncharacterized protein LOC141898247 n=1 Tax=Tubulanus polymorphus TaxID=672921 RepID=UPI003DA399AD